jgi:hypothetical protein
VADPFQKSLALMAEMDRRRIELISTDLDLCLTFADVAETEYDMGHTEHAERSRTNAEKGYFDMIRFFSQATGMTAEIADELKSKFAQLRERLDGLQRLR